MGLEIKNVQVKVFSAQVSAADSLGKTVTTFLKDKVVVQIDTKVCSGFEGSTALEYAHIVITAVYREVP